MKRLAPLLLLGALLLAAAPSAQPGAQTVSAKRLENVRLIAPKGTAKAVVVHFSDRSGWSAEDDRIATALRDDGAVVLGVDLAAYAEKLDQADGVCLYVVGEITDLAQAAERQLDIQTYLPPILVGRGEGATFAYAALADAPANTLGGAVASGFANRLGLRLPFCPGATATRTADDAAYNYGFDRRVPERATLYVDQRDLDRILRQAAGQDGISVEALDRADPAGQLAQAVATLADAIEPFGNLPVVDLPASTLPKAVAVIVSGDGGWRDLDKTIAEWLSARGVHVVGLDALHYFWSKRTPQQLAADVAQLLGDADPDGDLPVMLIGYSFGADTLPFAYPLLPKDIQDRIRLVALLAPGRTTSFQITVSGWLGVDDSGYEIVPAIAALPHDRVLCVFGKEDSDSACPDPTLKGITLLQTDGGHHFDGNYDALGQRFLDRLARK